MRNFKNQSHCIQLILALTISVSLSGCSDENENKTTIITSNTGYRTSRPAEMKKPTENKKAKSRQKTQSHGEEHYKKMSKPLDKASQSEKGKFVKEFTEDCLVRETMNSENKEYDRKRWAEPCECIAKYMTEHLTDDEAEEYLKDDNHTRSLQIRFEAAAYKCLQATKKPQAPKIFKH